VVNKEPARVTVVVHSTPVALNAACMCSIAAVAPESSEHVKMSQMAVCVSGHECTEMWLSASSATAVTPCVCVFVGGDFVSDGSLSKQRSHVVTCGSNLWLAVCSQVVLAV